MRIISDFHDYYDVGMRNGFDPQRCYPRFRKEIKNPFPYTWEHHYTDTLCANEPYGCSTAMCYIGFAGKIYPLFNKSTYFEWDGKPSPNYALSFDDIEPGYIEEFIERCELIKRKYLRNDVPFWREQFQKCFELAKHPDLIDAFRKFYTAIFFYRLRESRFLPDEYRTTYYGPLIINGPLGEYGFQKILPPLEAYQELSMYVGTHVSRPMIEAPPIPDKIMAEIKGG